MSKPVRMVAEESGCPPEWSGQAEKGVEVSPGLPGGGIGSLFWCLSYGDNFVVFLLLVCLVF